MERNSCLCLQDMFLLFGKANYLSKYVQGKLKTTGNVESKQLTPGLNH